MIFIGIQTPGQLNSNISVYLTLTMKRSHAGHVEEEKINYSEVDESKTDDSKILLQLLSSDEAAVVQACNLLASRPPTENGKIIKAVLKVYEESESANLCAEAASTLHSWTVCSDFPNSRNICVRRLYANCTLPTLINYLPRATSLVSSLSRSDVPTEEKQKITIQHLTTSIILVIWAFVEEIPPAIDQLGKNAQGTLGSFVISVLEKRDFLGPSVILPLLSLLLALYDDLFADLMSNETDTGKYFFFSTRALSIFFSYPSLLNITITRQISRFI